MCCPCPAAPPIGEKPIFRRSQGTIGRILRQRLISRGEAGAGIGKRAATVQACLVAREKRIGLRRHDGLRCAAASPTVL
jgi:hypothetical protein